MGLHSKNTIRSPAVTVFYFLPTPLPSPLHTFTAIEKGGPMWLLKSYYRVSEACFNQNPGRSLPELETGCPVKWRGC